MLNKSQNYQDIWDDLNHYAETKLIIGSREIPESNILSLEVSTALYGDSYDIGSAIMSQVQFVLKGIPLSYVPGLSRVEVWVRLWAGDGSEFTNWLPKGVFYTDYPEYNAELDQLSIVGYDELYKMNAVLYEIGDNESSVIADWDNPPLREVAAICADAIDIPLEDSTQVVSTTTMQAPPFGFSIRDIMCEIALACAGNWVLTYVDNNGVQNAKLRLVRANSIRLGTHVLITERGEAIVFGTGENATRILI